MNYKFISVYMIESTTLIQAINSLLKTDNLEIIEYPKTWIRDKKSYGIKMKSGWYFGEFDTWKDVG